MLTIPLIGLASCDSVPHTWTREDIAEIADEAASDHAAVAEARIDDLEAQVADLSRQIKGVRDLGLENAGNADRLREVVNKNARLSNEQTLREMTAQGACGTRMVQIPGGWRNEPIPCTEADFR